MSNRSAELKAIISQALDTPKGIILKVFGGDNNARTNAITALNAAKRELIPDLPQVLDLQIKAVPGKKDEIAIKKIESF